MKKIVILQDSSPNPYTYGATLVETDYISCYDIREAAVKLINEIFNYPEILNPNVDLEAGHTITVTMGGGNPYDSTFVYKTVDYYD